jgi:hypothetical protein
MMVDGMPAGEITGVEPRVRVYEIFLGVLDGLDTATRGRHRFDRLRWSRGAVLPTPVPRPEALAEVAP